MGDDAGAGRARSREADALVDGEKGRLPTGFPGDRLSSPRDGPGSPWGGRCLGDPDGGQGRPRGAGREPRVPRAGGARGPRSDVGEQEAGSTTLGDPHTRNTPRLPVEPSALGSRKSHSCKYVIPGSPGKRSRVFPPVLPRGQRTPGLGASLSIPVSSPKESDVVEREHGSGRKTEKEEEKKGGKPAFSSLLEILKRLGTISRRDSDARQDVADGPARAAGPQPATRRAGRWHGPSGRTVCLVHDRSGVRSYKGLPCPLQRTETGGSVARRVQTVPGTSAPGRATLNAFLARPVQDFVRGLRTHRRTVFRNTIVRV